jgi:hypothetical protein
VKKRVWDTGGNDDIINVSHVTVHVERTKGYRLKESDEDQDPI